jgi:acyl-homoserine lactone acylase PvdQ
MFASRNGANTENLASFNPATGESVFFDVVGTEAVERSDEVVLMALADALAFLRAAPDAPGEGGFGTTDMSQWIWGLRHQVRFESLLGGFLGQDSQFAAITDQFSITTRTLPLAENLGADDPRRGLKWFPRGGDQWNVDAANPGLGGTRFTHGNGPVMRMVIELKDGRVTGQNVVPGGQSGLTDSPHFSDQARLWLGNETVPLRFHPEDVAAGATGREVYEP